MNSAYASQMIVGHLLLILLSVLTIGMLLTLVAVRYLDRRRMVAAKNSPDAEFDAMSRPSFTTPLFDNPSRWLVIKSSNPTAAQMVLGLHNPKRCPWGEGLSRLTDHTLFISPPVDGWLLVVGPGLPDPAQDVDDCYRFIVRISRELGHVQFFSVNRAVNHYAWARAEGGRILRAYAWADETLWNQGRLTHAEAELGMKCFAYGDGAKSGLPGADPHQANTDKVLPLAARWSLDPTSLDERRLSRAEGIAGDLMQLG